MRKQTKRFENAITKLYTAFHNGTLDAFDCKSCAVGNIVGHGEWNGLGGTVDRETLLVLHPSLQSKIDDYPDGNGYSGMEYENIEYVFMGAWQGLQPKGYDKDAQFKGLCAVIEYLAELDNIPNPMDYSKAFEREGEKPKYELNTII